MLRVRGRATRSASCRMDRRRQKLKSYGRCGTNSCTKIRHPAKDTSGSGFFELHGKTADATQRGKDFEEICAPSEHQLGSASSFLRHAFATHCWRMARICARFRSCWARIAFHHAEVHACVHSPVDGYLRQGAPARINWARVASQPDNRRRRQKALRPGDPRGERNVRTDGEGMRKLGIAVECWPRCWA